VLPELQIDASYAVSVLILNPLDCPLEVKLPTTAQRFKQAFKAVDVTQISGMSVISGIERRQRQHGLGALCQTQNHADSMHGRRKKVVTLAVVLVLGRKMRRRFGKLSCLRRAFWNFGVGGITLKDKHPSPCSAGS
jgi:hypothetical protein